MKRKVLAKMICIAVTLAFAFSFPVISTNLENNVGVTIGTGEYVASAATPAISKKGVVLVKGDSTTLKVKNAKGSVKWKSSNSSVATVNSSGKVTAKKRGVTTITGTVGGKSYTCKVTVRNTFGVSNTSVTVKDEATITVKFTQYGTVTATVDDTYIAQGEWGTFNKNNKAEYYITGIESGSTFITFTNNVNSETFTVKVTVKKPELNSTYEEGYIGDKFQLKLQNTSQKPSWYSTDTDIATVSSTGLVTLKEYGDAEIVASLGDDEYVCFINVLAPDKELLNDLKADISKYGYTSVVKSLISKNKYSTTAYRDYLGTLYDLNKDGTPEFISVYDYNKLLVYSGKNVVFNGKIDFDGFGSLSIVEYNGKEYLCLYDSGTALGYFDYATENYDLYELVNGKLSLAHKIEYTYEYTYDDFEEDYILSESGWTIDGVSVDKSTYQSDAAKINEELHLISIDEGLFASFAAPWRKLI